MAKINRWPGTLDPSGSLKVTSEKFSAKEKCKRWVWNWIGVGEVGAGDGGGGGHLVSVEGAAWR